MYEFTEGYWIQDTSYKILLKFFNFFVFGYFSTMIAELFED